MDFSVIFASGALTGELLTFPSEKYLRGWGYLDKDVAPPMEYFNYLQHLSDEKDLYLFNNKADRSEVPTKLANPYSLIVKYGTSTYEYDGNAKVTINLSIATDDAVKAIVV